MEVDVFNMKGEKVSTAELSEAIFEAPVKIDLMHQAFVRQMANARLGTHSTKGRSEVSGGGRKPWRQKGTGRARAGTSRSPLWRAGGATFAAQPRSYDQKVNKKMYRTGIRSILSELNRQQRLLVVDDITVDAPKTKQMAAKLAELGVSKTLIVSQTGDESLYLSARNLPYVEVTDVAGMNPVNLVRYDHVVATVGAVRAIEEQLGDNSGEE